ncbi:hypothetical protein [Paenibacillus tuaregi]|uniref:hypothetical protein n=1 Tax=Paenibacillus tuaregi TaxID=1816681 RepID=UPI0008386244|nr:hypothetical protein [Paenibacillus tuaregi]
MENVKGKLHAALIWVLMALVVVSAFCYVYKFPQEIDMQYPAVKYKVGQPATAQQITVKAKGTLYRPLFRDPYFSGKMIIDTYEYTSKYNLLDIVFHQDIQHGYGAVVYETVENGRPILESLGAMWMKNDLEQFNIIAFEPIGEDKKIGGDLRVSAPARTYEEAMIINHDLYRE